MQRTKANSGNIFLNAVERLQKNAATLAAHNRATREHTGKKVPASTRKQTRSR